MGPSGCARPNAKSIPQLTACISQWEQQGANGICGLLILSPLRESHCRHLAQWVGLHHISSEEIVTYFHGNSPVYTDAVRHVQNLCNDTHFAHA